MENTRHSALWDTLAMAGSQAHIQQMCWNLQYGKEHVGATVSFQQKHAYLGRPLYNDLVGSSGDSSQSVDWWDKLKHCLVLEVLACPVKARLHRVVPAVAQFLLVWHATCRQKHLSYPIQQAFLYSIHATMMDDWYPMRSVICSGYCFTSIVT